MTGSIDRSRAVVEFLTTTVPASKKSRLLPGKTHEYHIYINDGNAPY
jgi:hypothetical protein